MDQKITLNSSREELLNWFFSEIAKKPLINFLMIRNKSDCSEYSYIQEGERTVWDKTDFNVARKIINILLISANLNPERARLAPLSGELDCEKETSLDASLRYKWRLETLPVNNGISIILRRENLFPVSFDEIGFLPEQLNVIKAALQHNGLIVVSGGTGAGKTNTMESLIQEFIKQNPEASVVELSDCITRTHDDRVQIGLDKFNSEVSGNNQPVKNILTSAIRFQHDLFVFNDFSATETADIFKYLLSIARTGHLVICEYHASDLEETIERLLVHSPASDILASALNLVVCQKLVKLNVTEQPMSGGVYPRHRTAVAEVLLFNDQTKSHLRRVGSARKLVNLVRDKENFLDFSAVTLQLIKNGKKLKS